MRLPHRACRRVGALVATFLSALALPVPVLAAGPESELAERYAPVIRLVEQTEECGHGEPYQPTDVEVVFGNEEVALRGPWDSTNLVRVAPVVSDLTAAKAGYALDFPGDALDPGCSYEEWSKRITAGSDPTTYARVVAEPGRPGRVALQYWFYYLFNDFNNTHEGDWEMIQLVFDAADAAGALGTSPSEIGYSQHEGAERATWGASKLELVEGTHPIVYPAAGSHANYYVPALFLGSSAAEGVGCDDTESPSRELRPVVKVVPEDQAAYLQEYPWLAYAGHWGERQPAFYNGPTGPNLKRQWTEPITWSEEKWRAESFALPASRSFGPTATDFFCAAVEAGSDVLTKMTRNPLPVALALGGIVIVLLWAASRTSWRRSAPLRLARRRPWGEIVTASWAMYRIRPGLFLAIGLLFLPLGIVVALLQALLFRVGLLEPLVDSAGESNAAVGALALGVGLLLTTAGLTVVQAATAAAMLELDEGRPVRARRAYAIACRRLPALLASLVVTLAAVILLDLTVVGIPIAAWLVVRWSLFAQIAVLEELPAHRSLRRSGALAGGHWWKVATLSVVVTGLGLLAGPLLGALLLFASDASFDFVNVIASVVYTIALPFAAIATTYLYFDVRTRAALAETAAKPADVLPAEIA